MAGVPRRLLHCCNMHLFTQQLSGTPDQTTNPSPDFTWSKQLSPTLFLAAFFTASQAVLLGLFGLPTQSHVPTLQFYSPSQTANFCTCTRITFASQEAGTTWEFSCWEYQMNTLHGKHSETGWIQRQQLPIQSTSSTPFDFWLL